MALGLRPDSPNGRIAASPEIFTDSIGTVCPVLLEYLVQDKWDDGKPRVTSTLSVFFEDGLFKLWLNDRDLERSVCMGGATLLQALASLDRRLEAGTVEWRCSRSRKRSGRP